MLAEASSHVVAVYVTIECHGETKLVSLLFIRDEDEDV